MIDDLNQESDGWTPSPIALINGQDISRVLQNLGETTSDYQDPDAIWNNNLFSLPLNVTGTGKQFHYGNHPYGFTSDQYNFTFANDSTASFQNIALLGLAQNFTGIDSGQKLYDLVDSPPPVPADNTIDPTSNTTTASNATATIPRLPITSLAGYPSPIVMHPFG